MYQLDGLHGAATDCGGKTPTSTKYVLAGSTANQWPSSSETTGNVVKTPLPTTVAAEPNLEVLPKTVGNNSLVEVVPLG